MTAPYAAPELLGDSAGMVAEFPHLVATTMFWVLAVYFLLLLFRLVTRRDWATIVVALTLLTPLFLITPIVGKFASAFGLITPAISTAAFVAIVVIVMMRVGLVTAMVFWFVVQIFQKIPLTFDMATFYAPQGMLGMLLLVAIAAYGFRYSLAGQSVFVDLLGDGPSTR